VADSISYYSDTHGVARTAIEGTTLPLEMIRGHAKRGAATVEFRDDRRYIGLVVTRRTEYFGFELDRDRTPLTGAFPAELVASAREALAQALADDLTPHPDQRRITRAARRLDEYWRRSSGSLPEASPECRRGLLLSQLQNVTSWEEFLSSRLTLDAEAAVSPEARASLDTLPTSVAVSGDRVALTYELENGSGVVRLHLREGQAKRLRDRDLPALDRPLRFAVAHGQREVRAESLEDLQQTLRLFKHEPRSRRHLRSRRRR